MSSIWLATNRGDIGGGEVMLLHVADGLRALGHEVTVVAPTGPRDLTLAAEERGHPVVALDSEDRRSYALALRRWDRTREGLLWCNGLLPAAATAGRPDRVVHLHQVPTGRLQRAAAALARRRARAVVVPSLFMAGQLGPSVEVLPNWTEDVVVRRRPRADDGLRVGFMGRVGLDKGVDILGRACAELDDDLRRRITLVIAGDPRFVPASDQAVVDAALERSGVLIERPGWISREALLDQVDVLVVPSVFDEPFGLVAAEAMAARVPVVVSDAGALPEVVGPTHPWVARRGDPASLAAVLANALRALPASDIVVNERNRWETHYSPAAGHHHLEALMRRLAQP